MTESDHFVQFYENDEFLLDSLSAYIGMGLSLGDACIVVATRAHRESLDRRLQSYGMDVFAARAFTQYLALDADETLSQLTVSGKLDAERFAELIGGLIARAAQGGRRVRVYGEMVALLWERGDDETAVQLETYWNDLRLQHSFMLLCAYPIKACAGARLADSFNRVCTAHSRVIPAESYAGLTSADERLRTIIRLQQKAESLEAQVAERKQTEVALRKTKEELETQVADLRRLHEMSVGLTATLDVEPLLEEVLRSAMAMHGTGMGLLSLCEPGRDGIKVRVHSGFDEGFLKLIEWVPAGGGACGTCYAERRRVIVEDVERDPIFADYRAAARAAGFRACHSTPLLTRNGHIIGVLSVHFGKPHRPSERETRLMDLYARMAADIIENARLHNRMQRELEEREQLLAREQQARAEAEAANRMKDQFLSTVSHELRTPLNAIVGWTHMLRHSKLDEAMVSRGLETIDRNARAQAQLVDDILDMSRVITGRLSLTVGSVDLAAVINKAIDSVQLAADSKNIRLGVTLDPTARHLSGDAGRLQQAIWNLLSNAIKFTPSGGRVEVRLTRNGKEAEIQVSDTGEGISRDVLPFIFDRFRQADGTSTRRHGGLGLGLAIVRHLMEMHGGTVAAESAGEGCGATFTLRLPLHAAHAGAKTEGAGGRPF